MWGRKGTNTTVVVTIKEQVKVKTKKQQQREQNEVTNQEQVIKHRVLRTKIQEHEGAGTVNCQNIAQKQCEC